MLEASSKPRTSFIEDASVSAPTRGARPESWFTGEWRTTEEIDACVAELTPEQIRALMENHDGTFWRGHPSASEVFRAVLLKLLEQEQPLTLLAECLEWIDRWQLPAATSKRLWCEAVSVLSSTREVDLAGLAALVRGRRSEDIYTTLEVLLETRPAASIEAALAQSERAAQNIARARSRNRGASPRVGLGVPCVPGGHR